MDKNRLEKLWKSVYVVNENICITIVWFEDIRGQVVKNLCFVSDRL